MTHIIGTSGRRYTVRDTLSVCRFEIFERMNIEVQYGVSLSAFRQELKTAYEDLNRAKFADASVRLHNSLNGVERILQSQPNPVLSICALFICYEGEDTAAWDETMAREKVDDWAALDIGFFLAAVKHFLRRYTANWLSDSPEFSADQTGSEGAGDVQQAQV